MSYHKFKSENLDEYGSFEVFYVMGGHVNGTPLVLPHNPGEPAMGLAQDGWYWWACFEGCLPDGEPNGPFETKKEAIEDGEGGP